MTRVVYLHGFASSPLSSKAQFFRRKFAACGVPMEIPELDEGRFEETTISSQLGVVERAVGQQPAILIGSSLGGYLAALYASLHKNQHPSQIGRLVLLAPAFQFPRRWRARYSEQDWERWRREGSTPVFHYGDGRERRLGYRFVEDAAQYEDEPEFPQPALILHGVHDDVVPAGISSTYAARRPDIQFGIKLVLLESGHELTDVLEPMWTQISDYLGVPKSIGWGSH
jgi:pimeloyl-ACP methyl ester carboxylesterase